MAKFCTKCGKPLEECTCSKNSIPVISSSNFGFLQDMKNRMGIGEPEINSAPPYERGMKIIPDCVKSSDGEIPVKQYTVAKLKNRLMGITIGKAEGRLEVTNKRVIFRAPGRCISGKMTLQQEFTIDEISGIEARREYVTTFWDFIIGFFVAAIGFAVGTPVSTLDSIGLQVFLGLILGIAALIPFFVIKKKWLLKLLCTGFSEGVMVPVLAGGTRMSEGIVVLLFIPALISTLIVLFNIFLYAIRPNLVLIVKTKSASEAIDVQRKEAGFLKLLFGGKIDEHTGYTEVTPMENTETAIRELGAVVSDIQKFGDFGIEKWQEPCFKTNAMQNR